MHNSLRIKNAQQAGETLTARRPNALAGAEGGKQSKEEKGE